MPLGFVSRLETQLGFGGSKRVSSGKETHCTAVLCEIPTCSYMLWSTEIHYEYLCSSSSSPTAAAADDDDNEEDEDDDDDVAAALAIADAKCTSATTYKKIQL